MQVKDFFFKKALAFIQSMVGCDIIHLVVVYFLKTKKRTARQSSNIIAGMSFLSKVGF